LSEWKQLECQEFLKWAEDEGNTASTILLHRAEWAVAHAVKDFRASGLVASEAYATAALVSWPGNESARHLLKDITAMRDHERRTGKRLPSLGESLALLNTWAELPNVDLGRLAVEAEEEANWRFSRGHHAAALPIVQRLVFVRMQTAGDDAVATLAARFLEARVLNFLGRSMEAALIAQDVIRKREQHPDLGPFHPSTLSSRLFVVPILSALGRSDEALSIAQDVASKREQHPGLGALHPSTLASRFLVAQILDKVGRSEEALPIAEDVASKAEQHADLGPHHPSTVAGRFLVAQILDNLGRCAEALPIAQDAAIKGEQSRGLGQLHPSTLISWMLVARILGKTGRSMEALPIAQDIAIKRKQHPSFGPLHPSTLASQTFVTQLRNRVSECAK
jgi:hypothetical protein